MTSHRQRLLDEAQWAIEHRQFDRAVRVYRQLFEAEPHSIQVGLKLGELYLKMEAREEALKVYWRLIHTRSEESEGHQRTLLKLVLKLDPAHLEAQLMFLERSCLTLRALEGDAQQTALLKRELTSTLDSLCELLSAQGVEERVAPLTRALSTPVEQLLKEEPHALSGCRLLYATTCESLGLHQEGLPYYVWATLDAERRGDSRQLARFGRLAISLDDQLDSTLRRHLRISFARALLPIASAEITLVEQVYFALEPLTQGEPSEDLEAHLLLGHLLRLQGHPLHADALLHQVGAEAQVAQNRSLAIVAYESILGAQPNDPIALSMLAELNSVEALFHEAESAFAQGELHHAFEYLRSVIERGASNEAIYLLLIQIADALELSALQESSRLTLLDWALQHKIELALEPTLELCQRRVSALAPFFKQHRWLYQETLNQLDEELGAWVEGLVSRDPTMGTNAEQDDIIEPSDHDDQGARAPSLPSARDRAQAQWSDERSLLDQPFTPAPLLVSSPPQDPTPDQAHQEPEGSVMTPASGAPQEPLISLPPLMSELPQSPDDPSRSSRSTLHSHATRHELNSSTRGSRALELYHEASEPTLPVSASVLSTQSQPRPAQEGLDLGAIVDPLSLFDSGASFQGALSSDHPLMADIMREFFLDEQDVVDSLDEQMSLIEAHSPNDELNELQAPDPPMPAQGASQSPHLDEIGRGGSEQSVAQDELTPELESPSFSATYQSYHSQRLHLGVHSSLPSLTERLTHLKNNPPTEAQRGIISLINAQEYELALSHIPKHLKTSSIHYLKAICLYGQGHLEEALELIEITLSRATPKRAEYFHALAAELKHALRYDEDIERHLIELLALDSHLGAVMYQALRS